MEHDTRRKIREIRRRGKINGGRNKSKEETLIEKPTRQKGWEKGAGGEDSGKEIYINKRWRRNGRGRIQLPQMNLT